MTGVLKLGSYISFFVGCFAFAISNGTDVMPGQYPAKSAVIVLQLAKDGRLADRCSGVLVAPQLVVTAEHCLLSAGEGPKVDASHLVIYFGNFDGRSWQHKLLRRVTAYVPHKGYSQSLKGTWANDLVMLKLETMAPAEFAPVAILGNPSFLGKGRSVTLAGFGNLLGYNDPAEPKSFILRMFNTFIDSPISSYGGLCRLYSSTQLISSGIKVPKTFGHPELDGFGGMEPGDSGGPMYVDSAHGELLAGIAQGYPDGDLTPYYVNIAAHSEWLKASAQKLGSAIQFFVKMDLELNHKSPSKDLLNPSHNK